MKIRKLDINGFGKFENRQFLLKPGMNVFYGCNEAGKSTLQSFIRGMFFGLKGGRRVKDGPLPPIKQYKPWLAKSYGGAVEYELDNGETFTVVRNFDRNTVTVYDQYSNNITGNFPAGREEGVKFAEQHLGLSESCFERTVFIGQMQSVINSEGKKVIAERLTNIKQTGDEEVSFRKAMNALKEAQLSYVGSERTTTRPLNIINSALQEAIGEEKEYIQLHESCMDMFLELDQLQKREEEIKTRLNELNRLNTKLVKQQEAEKLESVRQSLEQYCSKLTDIENSIGAKKTELENTLEKLKKYEPFKNYSRDDSDEMISDYTNYKLLLRDLDECELEKDENEEKISKIQNELEQYGLFSDDTLKMDEVIQEVLQYNREQVTGNSRSRKQGSGVKKAVSLAVLLTGIIVLIFSFLLKPYSAVVTAGGLIISGLGCALLVSEIKNRDIRKENIQEQRHQENINLLNDWMARVKAENIHDFIRLKNLFEDKSKRLEEYILKRQEIADRKNRILRSMSEYKARILNKLAAANVAAGPDFDDEDVQKWRDGLETYNCVTQSVKDIEAAISSLKQKRESLFREVSVIAGRDINLLTELEKELREKTAELEQLKQETGHSESHTVNEVEAEIKRLNEELVNVTLRINTLSTRLENTPDGEMIQKAHEKVQRLSEEREKKILLGKALETAMEVLTEASVEIQRNYSPYLNEAMGNIISAVTGGKYADVMADDSLTLNVQSPDIAEKVIPEQLSSGTADQIYFALRLATVMLVEKDGETLPLFLDEPFVQYDEERTKNTLMFLNKESNKRQIILFTCKKREVELCSQIFGDINIVNL